MIYQWRLHKARTKESDNEKISWMLRNVTNDSIRYFSFTSTPSRHKWISDSVDTIMMHIDFTCLSNYKFCCQCLMRKKTYSKGKLFAFILIAWRWPLILHSHLNIMSYTCTFASLCNSVYKMRYLTWRSMQWIEMKLRQF